MIGLMQYLLITVLAYCNMLFSCHVTVLDDFANSRWLLCVIVAGVASEAQIRS